MDVYVDVGSRRATSANSHALGEGGPSHFFPEKHRRARQNGFTFREKIEQDARPPGWRESQYRATKKGSGRDA